MSFRRKWSVIFIAWTLLGVLSASQHIAFLAHMGRHVPWQVVYGRTMLDWYTCAIFTPVIFVVADRFRLDRTLGRALPPHLLACVLFILLKLAIFLPIGELLHWIDRPVVFTSYLYGDAFALVLAYFGVVGARYAMNYYTTTTQLESRLARVQLDALRSQLHPHFLFNALNALSALIHRDVRAADRMILELSELLRHTLAEDSPAEVPLREELEFVKRYLAIMQIRFGERLRVAYDFAPETLDAYVPNMVLQPLVENALVHGIGKSSGPGEVAVLAGREDGMLVLQVTDDGPGIAESEMRERVGLRNTRSLLQQLYRQQYSLDMRSNNGRGVIAEVRLPFHTTALNS